MEYGMNKTVTTSDTSLEEDFERLATVELATDSKGMVKPRVKVRNEHLGKAALTAVNVMDRLLDAYGDDPVRRVTARKELVQYTEFEGEETDA
jgi:hypothetical protein